MPQEDVCDYNDDHKNAYFEICKLLEHRRHLGFGKKGLTKLPNESLYRTAPTKELRDQMFTQLVTDGILKRFEHNKKKVLYYEADGNTYVMSAKSHENIEKYTKSLAVPRGLDLAYERGKIFRRGKQNEGIKLTEIEALIFGKLYEQPNTVYERPELAKQLQLDPKDLSSCMNTIRTKMVHLKYTKKEAQQMLPPYKYVFFRKLLT